ncbi:hypothetical protein [Plebeiibacterium sediminum]|uniref:Uncharacterized protein n=1 Tax=Plebeiibacterium sediminum TaxID=2992112 RepID=A0AAE3M2J3_9BACT|nr:hypothetical protein [Plebeiobacterium sediminum]MCW3785914.1 hypothetical protein [Plebeiobacterium sediminum]
MNSLKGNKKIYSKPELEVVAVDHEISLVMMTSPPPGEGENLPTVNVENTLNSSNNPVNNYSSSSDSYPFGSNSPEYNK